MSDQQEPQAPFASLPVVAVPYARVSGAQQTRGTGLDRQSTDPQTYVERRGWRLWSGSYNDAGVSAYAGDNLYEGALGRFLEDVEEGRFGACRVALLIEDVDRFSRACPTSILPLLLEDLLQAGIILSVTSKDKDYSVEGIHAHPFDLHELLMLLGASHDFSNRLSKRISYVHSSRREDIRKGKPVAPGLAPTWIDLVDGKWVFNDYAEVLRRILTEIEAIGCTILARKLEEEGVPTPSAYRGSRAKSRWSTSVITTLVHSEAIHGSRRIGAPGYQAEVRRWKETIARLKRKKVDPSTFPQKPQRTFLPSQEDYYPALVSKEEHQRILRAVSSRQARLAGRTDQMYWIGAGITFCSCGAVMGGTSSTDRHSGLRRRYLRCKSTVRCRARMVPLLAAQAHLLTRLTTNQILALIDAKDAQTRTSKLAQALQAHEASAASVRSIQDRLRAGELSLAAEEDPAVVTVLARRQADLSQKLSEAEKELKQAQIRRDELALAPSQQDITISTRNKIREFLHIFERGEDTAETRRRVNRHLIKLGLRISVETHEEEIRIGMQLDEGPTMWCPLAPIASCAVLHSGKAGVIYDTLPEDFNDKLSGLLRFNPEQESVTIGERDGLLTLEVEGDSARNIPLCRAFSDSDNTVRG